MKRILKWAGIVFGALIVLGVIGNLASGGKSDAPSAPAASPAGSTAAKAANTPKPQPTATPAPGIGDTVVKGNWEYTVTDTEQAQPLVWSQYGNTTDAKGVWQIVYVTLRNVGKETYPLNSWDFELHDAQGIKFKGDYYSDSFSEARGLSKPFDRFPPGVKADVALVFDVNPEAEGLRLYAVQAKQYFSLE